MATRKTWAERWGSVQLKMPDMAEAVKILQKLRNSTARRIASLKKHKAFSYAAQTYEQEMQKHYMLGKAPSVKSLTWPQVESELGIHHDFWASKTSTLKGAREVQLDQSRRIFGVKAGEDPRTGTPARIITYQESTNFWKVYDEFYSVYKNQTAAFDSSRIQRLIGARMQYNSSPLENMDLMKLLSDVRQQLQLEEYADRMLTNEEMEDLVHQEANFFYSEVD